MNQQLHPVMAEALALFAPKPQDAPPPIEKGLIRLWLQAEFVYEPLACDFDYEPGESGSWQHGQQQEPDTGANMTLHKVWCKSVNITALVSDAAAKHLTNQAMRQQERAVQ